MRNRKTTKAYAVTAVLSALSCAIMLATYFAETASLTVAALAALPVLILLAEYGNAVAAACYVLTTVISLLICPVKDAPAAYAIFFGIYPILKRAAEMKSKPRRLLIKGAVLVAAVGLYCGATLLFFPDEMLESTLYKVIFIPVCVVAFVLYDKCLTLFMQVYARRLRSKIAKYL